jgi:hypothetical protein
MRTVSAGGGHGPILLGKSEVGGRGGQLRRPRDLLIPMSIYREIFYTQQRFFQGSKNVQLN